MDEAQKMADQNRERERAAREAQERVREAERERTRDAENRKVRERLDHQERERRERLARIHQNAHRTSFGANTQAYLNWNKSIGKRWMAERGPFGLTGPIYPIAKVLGTAEAKVFELGSLVTHPIVGIGLMKLSQKFSGMVDDINRYEESLNNQRLANGKPRIVTTEDAMAPDARMETIGHYQIAVKGTVGQEKTIVREIARAFADRLAEMQLSNPSLPRDQVSSMAHKLVQTVDAPDICRKFGIKTNQLLVEPITGVTTMGGGQARYDLGIEFKRRVAMIELKSSGYETERTQWQLKAQQIGVGERTATYGKSGVFYKIKADERIIQQWEGNTLSRNFRPPKPKTPRIR